IDADHFCRSRSRERGRAVQRDLKLLITDSGDLNLSGAVSRERFDVGHGDLDLRRIFSRIVLRRPEAQRVTSHLRLDKRQEIVVGFDLESLILLTDDFDIKRAVSRDGGEGRDVSLLRDALAGSFNVRAETVMTSREQNRQQYNQRQQLFHDCFSFVLHCSRRAYSSVRVVLSVTLPIGSPKGDPCGRRKSGWSGGGKERC